MFELKNVSKKYKDEFALRNITMSIGKGLNFIIGSSGSGKTTLLKIISGMEPSFDGEVLYCGQSIQALTEQEKSYFYNNVFGFVWQDFNLLDELTVLENVMLSEYLKEKQDKNNVMKVLRELKISELAHQKCGKLSGGQKQRVAIARELIKNPQVIIADEPTSALDEKSAKTTMDILRDISKSRMVIVVTHDTSLIDPKSKVYELDKGELISFPDKLQAKVSKLDMKLHHSLSLSNACRLGIQNTKSRLGRFSIAAISLCIATTLLLVTVSGAIAGGGQSEFDKLLSTYGDGLLDIGLYNSFIDASGADGKDSDKPNGDVTQDISGLFDKYANDKRVDFISYMVPFNNIKIVLNGKEYQINNSGNTPVINKLVAGNMPSGNEHEVVVPNSFVDALGLSPNEAIGKEITFSGDIVDWSSGSPVYKNTFTKAKIVGVMDTTVRYDYEGKMMEFTVDDSFLFNKAALVELHEKVGKPTDKMNVLIRAKTPEGMIAIKDELNKNGIVPIGRFELVEDIVRLNNQTAEQSGTASIVIGLLSMVIVLATSMMTAMLRRREYAIYKVTGFCAKDLTLMTGAESLITVIASAGLFLSTSPLINLATTELWNVNILKDKLLMTGVLLVLALSVLYCIVTIFISVTTKAVTSLKTGDR